MSQVEMGRSAWRVPRNEFRDRPPLYVWLFVAGLISSLLSGYWDLVGFPTGLDRPLLFLAVVLALLDPQAPQLRHRAVLWVMAACALWTLASWLLTGSPLDTAKAFAFADRIVVPFVMFCAGAVIFQAQIHRDVLMKGFILVGVYLGVTGIGEVAGISWLVWPGYILEPDLGIQFGRARGPFLYSEAMGMTAALCFVLAIVFLMERRGAWRIAAIVCLPMAFSTVVLSLTRSVWLGGALALLTMLLGVPSLRRWLLASVVAVVVAVGVALAVFPSLAVLIFDRAGNQRSVYDRVLTNEAALRIIEERPLTGIGWGNFFGESSEWVRQADLIPLSNVAIEVHNVFLSRAAETGLVGAVLWGLAMLMGPVAAAISNRRRGIDLVWSSAALAAVSIWLVPTMLSPNSAPLPNNLVWLIGGIAGGTLFAWPPNSTTRAQAADLDKATEVRTEATSGSGPDS